MTLRKEIDPKTYENHFTEMTVPRSIGVQVIDATRTLEDYQNDVLALRRRFGETTFDAMVAHANQMACASEKQCEAAQAAKNAEIPEPNLLLMYSRALASNDPLAKNEFLERQTTENLNAILTEISGNPRHYNCIFKYEIGYAIDALVYYIATRPAPKPSIAERIKTTLGV